MRRTLLSLSVFLLALPATAGETVVDGETGLSVTIPDGWDHDTRSEQGAIRFAAVFDVGRNRYVMFQVQAGPSAGFDEAAWLANAEKETKSALKQLTEPFMVEKGRKVGGRDAVAFTAAGKMEQGGSLHDVRHRVRGVVKDELFFLCRETSFNGAHDEAGEALDAMWSGIAFQAGGALPAPDMDEPAGAGEPTKVKDEGGNYELTLPPGWVVLREAPEDDTHLRMVFARKNANDDNVALVEVWVVTSTNPSTFTAETAGDVLLRHQKQGQFFESYYGEGSGRVIEPQIDGGTLLGGIDKSCSYEYRSQTLEEQAKIREAQTLRARGQKDVEVPDIKPLVVRGRVALLSPNIYIVRAQFARSLSDDPKLVEEYTKLLDSWTFLQTDPIPPPLSIGGMIIGNTKDDPAFAKEREIKKVYTETARRTHQLEVECTLPPGFQRIEQAENGNLSLLLVAQDAQNNWARIEVLHSSQRAVGERNLKLRDKKEYFEEWASNWSSKARGTRIPRRDQKVRLGRWRGDGYKELEGTVERFPGTFTAALDDDDGFRTIIMIETRGRGHEVWEEQIEDFFKSMKMRAK